MKQIFINGNATTLFFSENATIEDIRGWLEVRMNQEDNIFSLNEAFSCYIETWDSDTLLIRGDEDSCQIDVDTVYIIF